MRELWEDSFFLIGGFLLRECYGLLGDAFVCVALDSIGSCFWRWKMDSEYVGANGVWGWMMMFVMGGVTIGCLVILGVGVVPRFSVS